ncbi:helix-turn-helix domain-containing protein [Halomicrobium sp. HM KBTZ05]|uniref:helix-turn-helix domain-containing protein n=1 Tax=Halomicrobium sp. HM KBTZ05 TaxID=3242663 RepID=UPI003557F0F3
MSVIADLRVPATKFELGRILAMEQPVSVVLETMVPMGQQTVPFFWVHDHDRDVFEEAVREHHAVERLREVEVHEHRVLYAFRWRTDSDELFAAFAEADAQLLEATGHTDIWEFELRFPDHEHLSTFKEYCDDADIDLDVRRIYNPTKPESGPYYGLSHAQREALSTAVSEGYYSIPRRISTKELGGRLGISDQATTERLRRAIITLTEHTLLTEDDGE